MIKFINEFLIKQVKKYFNNTLFQIREINKKYAVPQIKTGPAVTAALLLLRIYLILLIVLLVYKFITLL